MIINPMKYFKSKITSLLLLLFCSFNMFSQEVGFEWGKPDKIEKKSISPDFLGRKEGKIFVLKSNDPKEASSYFISIIDETTLDEDDKIDFDKLLPKDIGKNDMFDTYLLNDKIVVVTVSKNKELFATTIDLKGKIMKGKIPLDKVEGKDKTFDGFRVVLSPDKSKILGYRTQKGKVKQTIAFNFVEFDENLKRVKSEKIELPYEDDNFDFQKVSIDNNGDVFAVAKIKIEGKRKKFDTHKSVLMNLPLSQAKPELNEVILPFEKRIASSMSFVMQANKIIITGMYASNKDADNLEGVFYIELNPQNFEVLQSTYQKFKPGLQTREYGKSDKMLNNVGFDYLLKDIFIDKEDQKFLTFENVSVFYSSSKSGQSKQIITSDIIVIKLNSENKIQWNSIINKNQSINIPITTSFGFNGIAIEVNVYKIYKKYEDLLSYTILYKNNDIYFVFNDHINNMNSKITNKTFDGSKKSYSALVKLDGVKGKWEKKAMFKNKDSKRLITPNNSVQISDNKILTFSFLEKFFSMGYLSID